MVQLLPWPVLLTLAAGIGTVYLIYYLYQYRSKPGAKWFILTLVAQAVFCFAYGIGLLVYDPTVRYWLEIIAFIGLGWLSVPFLGFALGYTGRDRLLQSTSFTLLLLFPAGASVLLFTNHWHELFITGFEVDPTLGVATASYTLQPIAFFGILGGSAVVALASLLLFDTVLSYGPLYRGEAYAVALSPIPPIIGLLPWLIGFGPFPMLNTIAIGLLPHVFLDVYAFVGSGMFEFNPATNRAAERSTINDLDSPVIFLEDEGRIVDLNEEAQDLLDERKQTVITTHISNVLTLQQPLDELADSEDTNQLAFDRDGQPREYLLRVSTLSDSRGNRVGYTIFLQDITEALQREERLSVLNRVLRHNLRNDLTVITGYIEEVQQQASDEDLISLLEQGRLTANELGSLGETAREIEETIGRDIQLSAVETDELFASLSHRIEAIYPQAELIIQGETGTIRTDKGVLTSVLWELVENAVVHNDTQIPKVNLDVIVHEDEITFTVVDNGDGIPEHEIASLQSGDESALAHGSGLGLWLVKWGTARLGGDLSFFGDQSDGGRVSISVPRR